MRRISQALLCLGLMAIGFACSPPTSKFLIPRPDPASKVKDSVGDIKLIFKPTVDILFVVDDSGSMGGHQTNLATNIDLFTSGLGKTQILDYHIGVTTTDFGFSTSGTLRGFPNFVDKNTPDGLIRLRNNLIVGTSGSGTESVFKPTIDALSEPNLSGSNKGFYRPEAYLALVFVTDAVDQSDYQAPDTYNFLMNLKDWDREKVISYGVIIPSSEKNCDRDDSGETPLKIEEFLHMTKGISFSLCAPDYGQRLAAIGDDLVRRVGMFIPMKQIPVVKTIQVKYGTQIIEEDVDAGWSYDPGRVGINLGPSRALEEQPAGTELEVTFVPALLEAP